MIHALLQMGWPAAVVLIVLTIGLVVVYGIRTANAASIRDEKLQIQREAIPSRELIEQ